MARVLLLLLLANPSLSYISPPTLNQLEIDLIKWKSRDLENSRYVTEVEDMIIGKDETGASLPQDLIQRATSVTTSTTASNISQDGGLNSVIAEFVNAFSCVGNASDLFAGLESLLIGLGSDPTFINAAADVLFNENFTLFEIPSFFLGIGVGESTIVGLNASTVQESQLYANNAISASGANDTGMNPLFRRFGQGLANVTLPALFNSNADDFLAGLNLSEFVGGAGIGIADGIGTVLKPILGSTFFDVSVNGTGNFEDPKGAGAISYSFTRGLASQLANLGLGFLGIGNKSTYSRQAISKRVILEEETFNGFLGHTRGIVLPDRNSIFESSEPLLINSSKTEQLTTSLAQAAVDRLSCQGVGGAVSLFSNLISSSHLPVPSLPDLGRLELPDILLVIRNDGNVYEIGLENLSVSLNGISINKLIALVAAHSQFSMTSEPQCKYR